MVILFNTHHIEWESQVAIFRKSKKNEKVGYAFAEITEKQRQAPKLAIDNELPQMSVKQQKTQKM